MVQVLLLVNMDMPYAQDLLNKNPLWFRGGQAALDNSVDNNSWEVNNRVYVTCSPFRAAPTAAHAVAQYFTAALNKYLEGQGLPEAKFFQIHRRCLFEGDYGKLTEKDRRSVMAEVRLTLPQDIDLHNSNLLVIDDIRITGAHEKAVLDLVMNQNPKRVCKMYVAMFEQDGAAKATLEARLNNALVKNLVDLDNLIKGMRTNYIPNSRVCKFLLSEQDLDALRWFLKRQSPHLIRQLYDYMQADGYAEMESYKAQLEVIKQVLSINNTQSSQKLVGLGLSMLGGAMFCKIQS